MITHQLARFTVVTPCLIRLEFDPDEGFEDRPTLFAANREARCADYQSRTQDSGALELETSDLLLRYLPDGERFHAGNLGITIKATGASWFPGKKSDSNLGGPLETLDGCKGKMELPEGPLSRDGWHCHDDSATVVCENGWIRERRAVPAQRMNWRQHYPQEWYFFGHGLDFKQALKDLATLSGAFPLPPRALLGSWYCRWYPYTSDDYRQLVQEYADKGYPLDVLVFDMDWHRLDATQGLGHHGICLGWTGWSWNRSLLPDAEALVSELKSQGLSISLNLHPHDGMRPHEDAYEAFMEELGEDPASGKSMPLAAGDQAYMEALFKHAHHPKESEGVDFWWVDWQQDDIMPFVPGKGRLKHLPWLNRLYYENARRNGRRGVSFSRWGGWGDHKHPIHFSGDTFCNWEALAFEIEFTLRSANTGCFFWSHDLGGFAGERNGELYARWLQFGAVSAVFRLHSHGKNLDRRPWTWDEPFESSMKASFRLRTELFPYIYSSAAQCHHEAVPLLRPMYLDHPERLEAYDFMGQFFLGEHLLASPVASEGDGQDFSATQEVWLPPGQWYDWWTGERFEGDRRLAQRHDINSFPLFVRAGAVIPLQDPHGPMAKTLPETLRLRCFTPAGEAAVESLFYEDDGTTEAYKGGKHHLGRIYLRNSANGQPELSLRPSPNGFPWRQNPPVLTIETVGFQESKPVSKTTYPRSDQTWQL